MPHKADKKFFKEKRSWSKRKDEILGSYLTAYLAKVMHLRAPILIVDGFAGPGRFEDGSPGSPQIIAGVIEETLSKNLRFRVDVSLLCVEAVGELYAELPGNLKKYPFASPRDGTFDEVLDDLRSASKRSSLFIYADPFTVEGLDWHRMVRVFESVREGRSVEILLNFNASSFVRRGLGALSIVQPDAPSDEDVDAPVAEIPSVEKLNSIVGGDWWISIVQSDADFSTKVNAVTRHFSENLRAYFSEVGVHEVKEKPHHTVAKYALIFASRHPDAIRLMNDQMVKSHEALAEMAAPTEPVLFEMRSVELVPDTEDIPQIILKYTSEWISRGELIVHVIRERFCQYPSKVIRGTIESMLKAVDLESESGKSRINDSVRVRAPRV